VASYFFFFTFAFSLNPIDDIFTHKEKVEEVYRKGDGSLKRNFWSYDNSIDLEISEKDGFFISEQKLLMPKRENYLT